MNYSTLNILDDVIMYILGSLCGEERVRKVDTRPPQNANHKHIVLFICQAIQRHSKL